MNTYALTMSPVAMSLEELIPSSHAKSYMYSILIRTALVISTLIVGLSIPFFGKFWSTVMPLDSGLYSYSSCFMSHRSRDGADRFFTHHASCKYSFLPLVKHSMPPYILLSYNVNSLFTDLDPSVCVLLEHLEGEGLRFPGKAKRSILSFVLCCFFNLRF